MRLHVRSTALTGEPLDTEVESFTGDTSLDLVREMRAARRFAERQTLDEFIESLVAGAQRFAGIELVVKGETADERASSLVGVLLDTKLATITDDEPSPADGGKEAHA
jgi:hypothetical protein